MIDSDQVNTIGEQGKAIEDVNSFEKDDSGHFDSKGKQLSITDKLIVAKNFSF